MQLHAERILNRTSNMVLDLPPPVLSQVFWLDNPVTVCMCRWLWCPLRSLHCLIHYRILSYSSVEIPVLFIQEWNLLINQ